MTKCLRRDGMLVSLELKEFLEAQDKCYYSLRNTVAVLLFEPQAHSDQLLRWWYYGLEVSGADV